MRGQGDTITGSPRLAAIILREKARVEGGGGLRRRLRHLVEMKEVGRGSIDSGIGLDLSTPPSPVSPPPSPVSPPPILKDPKSCSKVRKSISFSESHRRVAR